MKLTRNSHREQKRKQAEERKRFYESLTISERINLLDERLGKGKGAKKERTRLSKLLSA